MKTIKRVTAFILIMTLIITLTITTFAETSIYNQYQQVIANSDFLEYVKDYIVDRYKGDITEAEVLEGALKKIIKDNPQLMDEALKGMFDQLDDHSTFFTDEEYQSFSTSVDGQFGGIGISVVKKDGNIAVLTPLKGTPGEKSGLQPGDRIIYVDDTDVSDYEVDLAVPIMRGEPGTPIKLGIKRDGHNEILYFNIIREIIKINPIYHEIMEDNIGYIGITDFNSNTTEYLEDALKEFDTSDIKKLIIDVRNNPGGSLDQVVRVANNFIPNKGKIVTIEYKNTERIEEYHSELENAKYEIIVLINGGSASASEILAAAIQDSEAGIVIGEKSFGKGTVQELIPLKIGGAVKMTIAKYFTPSGKSIDGDGVHPDRRIKNKIKTIDVDTLKKFDYINKPDLGDEAKEVLAAEERLKLLGYDIDEPDEILDKKTYQAIKNFQQQSNLYAYGVLDFMTQLTLDSVVDGLEVFEDRQLEKAIEILKGE